MCVHERGKRGSERASNDGILISMVKRARGCKGITYEEARGPSELPIEASSEGKSQWSFSACCCLWLWLSDGDKALVALICELSQCVVEHGNTESGRISRWFCFFAAVRAEVSVARPLFNAATGASMFDSGSKSKQGGNLIRCRC